MIARFVLAALLGLGLLAGPSAWAHEGHDHGDVPALPKVYEPRFEAAAGAIEVVGIVKGEALWLFASRLADNTPWSGLTLALEQDAGSVAAQAAGNGVYRVAAGPLAQPGTHAVIVSAEGDGLDELLTAELVVSDAATDAPTQPLPRWVWGLIALAVLSLVVWLLVRRSRR